MTDLLRLTLDLSAGLVVGAIFYGGLWWTIRRLPAKGAGLWLVGSFLVRTTLALAGFYIIARGMWYGAAACLVGFPVARMAVTCITRVRLAVSPPLAAGSGADGAILGAQAREGTAP
jgi:F1F0 ATPase subunit 2